jgi:hypothetical protein
MGTKVGMTMAGLVGNCLVRCPKARSAPTALTTERCTLSLGGVLTASAVMAMRPAPIPDMTFIIEKVRGIDMWTCPTDSRGKL